MEASSLSPLSSPSEITSSWLEQVLRHKFGSSLKLVTWSMKLPEIRNGFLSEMCFVEACFSMGEGKPEEKRSLVAKFLPNMGEDVLEMMKNSRLAEREAEVYKYASSEEFQVFCEKSGLQHPVPEVYWAGINDNKMTIVLHDLRSDGLRLSVPPEGNSLKQTKCVMSTIAVIHASGIAAIKKHGKHPVGIPLDLSLFKDYVTRGLNTLIELFKDTPLATTLTAILSRANEFLSIKRNPAFDTLIHGDLWSANSMFSDDDNITSIFDWQFAQIHNIAFDIVTFLILSSETSSYTDDLTEVLKCYWESFEQSLKRNGVTVDVTFEDFVSNVESMWVIGFIFLCSALPFLMERHLSEDRVRFAVLFMEEKGVLKSILS